MITFNWSGGGGRWAETDQSTEQKVKEWPGRKNWTVDKGREFHRGCGPGPWGTSQTHLGLSIVRRAAFYLSLPPKLTSSPDSILSQSKGPRKKNMVKCKQRDKP